MPLVVDPVSTKACPEMLVRLLAGAGARICTGMRSRLRSLRHSIANVRPEAEVDRLVRDLLDGEDAVWEAIHAGAIGITRAIEEIDDATIAHQGELIAMIHDDAAQRTDERVVVALYFRLLTHCIHECLRPATLCHR